ncbi:MAG: DUF2085 domain-containing protein [Candidatus Altiarchaeales archaeon]|nr:DUF2085 domain-containing protein [Candidatus Altiarchaeales archaeon]MBD3415848.1 DUF2085 domain-containing protein [Candidatus Altiarchaeales archaeon]
MKDEDDPFLAVVDFLSGKDKRAVDFGLKLESLYVSVMSNLYMIAYLLLSSLALLMLSSSFMIASENDSLRSMGALLHVFAGLSFLCHQLPYRSFIFDGVPMAVCARDTGIYLGAILGFATVLRDENPPLFRKMIFPLACALPIGLDGVTQTVLLLRESNNVLRLITGLIFSFGLLAYLGNRLLLSWYPDFKSRVLDFRAIVPDLAVVAFVIWLMFSTAADNLDFDYLSRSEAIQLAKYEVGIAEPEAAKAYYIPSKSPISIVADPHEGASNDLIVSDVRSSEWAKDLVDIFTGDKSVNYTYGDRPTTEFISEIAEREHKFGVWAVALLEEEPRRERAPYISEGRGKYAYIDALNHEIIEVKTH